MKLRKKTLLIAGSLSLALGVGIVPQQVAAQNDHTITAPLITPIQANEQPSVIDSSKSTLSTTFSKKVGTEKVQAVDIVFRAFSSYKELIRLFPEAQEMIEQYGVNASTPDIYSEGYFAKVSNDLYLFRTESPDVCGTGGCMTVTFSLGEIFYPSAYILSPEPPSLAHIDDKGEPSIFTCNARGEYYEWKRRENLEMAPLRQPEDCTSVQPSQPIQAPQP